VLVSTAGADYFIVKARVAADAVSGFYPVFWCILCIVGLRFCLRGAQMPEGCFVVLVSLFERNFSLQASQVCFSSFLRSLVITAQELGVCWCAPDL